VQHLAAFFMSLSARLRQKPINTINDRVPPWSYTPSRMDRDTKDILETVNFIEDHMVTKADFDDAVEKLDVSDSLCAVPGCLQQRIKKMSGRGGKAWQFTP
jgi:hypothetical protein